MTSKRPFLASQSTVGGIIQPNVRPLPRAVRWHGLLAFCCLLQLIPGCQKQVTSPTDSQLDPANVPVPTSLSALVADSRVILAWKVSSADSAKVSRFLIYRIDSLNAKPRRLDSALFSPYVDSTAINGTLYAYAVSVRGLEGIEGQASTAIRAQPRFVSLRINDDSLYTRSADVRLSLSAAGATLMRFAEDTTQPSSWRSFATTASWALLPHAGPKRVFAQFQFADGAQFDGWVGDSIVLDDRAQIYGLSLSDSVLSPGDSLTLVLDAAESLGTATYDLGGGAAISLFDDGISPDQVTQDGRYSGRYVATAGNLFDLADVRGHFVDRAGNRAPDFTSAWKVSVRQPPVPPVWVGLVGGQNEPTVLNLTWVRVTSEPFSQLLLRRSKLPAQGIAAQVVALFSTADVTQYRDTGLVGSTTYYYTLQVVLTNGLKALSAEISGPTPADLPPDPVLVAVSPTADSSLLLSWTKSTAGDFESYRVYRSGTSAPLNSSPPADSLLVSVITGVETTLYEESGQDQFYYYRVFVYDRSGQRSGSNVVWGPKDFGP
jgi:hypothetical protein